MNMIGSHLHRIFIGNRPMALGIVLIWLTAGFGIPEELMAQETPKKETTNVLPSEKPQDSDTSKIEEPDWDGKAESLFEKDSLQGWETIEYGATGECRIENGVLEIESGAPMTGISSTRKDLPKTNYEISLLARRVNGIDMFCGLTFPVDESHCSFIVGGWSGGTVGLSCIDDRDASSNDTKTIMKLNSNQWYRIRVRVLPEKIIAWIDDEVVVTQLLKGHKISLRTETVSCKPLGLCTFQTTAETKDFTIRKIKATVQGDR